MSSSSGDNVNSLNKDVENRPDELTGNELVRRKTLLALGVSFVDIKVLRITGGLFAIQTKARKVYWDGRDE